MSDNSTENMVYAHERPGCITAYAVLLWLGGGLFILSSFSLLSDPSFGPLGAAISGLFAILLIGIGIGLWRMQSWGWWLVVILQSLGLLTAFFSLIGGVILNGLVSGLVSGGILYWFITNRRLFLEAHTYRPGVGSDGKPVNDLTQTSKNNNTTFIIVGVILAVFLVPVCIIAILALLGPQIGDVFSRITSGLAETPMP